MKTVKHFGGILPLFIFGICLWSCIGPIPVDVVMMGNELVFVLEEEQEISAIQVTAFESNKGKPEGKTMWALRHDLTTEVKKRKYPRLRQIKYGQVRSEFPQIIGPAELKRNVEYLVAIDMGDKFAREVFVITGDNKIIMPRRAEGKSSK
jgi:hypothetical protein